MSKHDICFVGLNNLPVLAREYNHLGAGGEQLQHTLLSRALARRGYDMAMVVLDHGQPDGAAWHGVTTYRAYRPAAGVPVLRFFHPRWTGIWSALARADAKVYYTSCAGMLVGLMAMFCRLHRRRLVFRSASNADCHKRSSLVPSARDRRLYEFGLRRCDAVLTQTDAQQRDLKANFGLDSRVAGMLVDAPDRVLDLAERDIDVLWVNNFGDFKRPDRYVDLARRLPQRRFVMIGGAGPGLVDYFEKMKAYAAGAPNLEFLGRVPYHEVNDYYSRARVFVNTSDVEGYPNSYLQAWIRGTPVATFIDPDGVIAREGLGAAPASDEEMAAAVERLLADEERWRQDSRRAVAYMAREFAEADILRPYLEAFALPARA